MAHVFSHTRIISVSMKRRMAFGSGLLFAALVAGGASLRADSVLAQWTFETSAPTAAGPLRPEVGSGVATASASGVWSNPVGNGSGESWSGNKWKPGDYFQFNVDSAGVSRFEVSWAQVGSNTGPRDFALSYSLDGQKYVWLMDYSIAVNAATSPWTVVAPVADTVYSFEVDLPGPHSGVIYFRLSAVSSISAGGGSVLPGGACRVDDFTVTGKQ